MVASDPQGYSAVAGSNAPTAFASIKIDAPEAVKVERDAVALRRGADNLP